MILTEEAIGAETKAASLSNLRSLELSSKGIVSLPGLTACTQLSKLSLNGNALSSVEARRFAPPPLRICILHGIW